MPLKFLEHIIIWCFERRYRKQIVLFSKNPFKFFWPTPNFWASYAIVYRYGTHTAQQPASLFWCDAMKSFQFTCEHSFVCIHVAKLASALLCCCSLLRNNDMATNLQRFTSSCDSQMRLSQCCQPCGFPANSGLCFCGVAFFLRTCGLLVFGLVLIEICLFFGLVFRRFFFCGLLFWNFMALLLFQYTT